MLTGDWDGPFGVGSGACAAFGEGLLVVQMVYPVKFLQSQQVSFKPSIFWPGGLYEAFAYAQACMKPNNILLNAVFFSDSTWLGKSLL